MDLSLQDLFLKLRDQREAPGVNAVKGTDCRQYLARIAGILKPEPQGPLKGLWKQMADQPDGLPPYQPEGLFIFLIRESSLKLPVFHLCRVEPLSQTHRRVF